MVMSWIWVGICAISLICAMVTGRGTSVSGALFAGAQSGVSLSISIAGAMCLWCGVAKLMERSGISRALSRLLRPILYRLFPSSRKDAILAGDLSANICANIFGLGNAATPMGIRAAKRLKYGDKATDELCRLVVLNTASIQLIPSTVAAVRASLGASAPFDILPAVWLTSFCSAGLGVAAAYILGRVCKHA